MLIVKQYVKERGRSDTRNGLAELDFFVYFFSGFAFQRNWCEQMMKKSKSQSRLERQSQINVEMSSLTIHINFYKHYIYILS
jgi:hypothetical protein